MSRHLDLGCGSRPRNPYGCDELWGVDLGAAPAAALVRRANLAVDAIPFDSGAFDSVSAYDFFEHIPRVLGTPDGRGTRFPFIELMNEIWRVLRHEGRLYASTPVYPAPQVFVDPTHVNVLTQESHRYFVQPELTARMYGFVGDFRLLRTQLWSPTPDSLYAAVPEGFRERSRHARRLRRGEYSHIVWEFAAQKAAVA
jgi:SAM-dependent methyltransferase